MLNKFTITLLGLGIVFVLGVGLWSVTSTSRAILATTVDNVLASPAEFTEKKVELSGYIVESDIMPNYSLQSSAPFGSEAGLSSENILSEGIGITGDPAALQQLTSFVYEGGTKTIELVQDNPVLITLTGVVSSDELQVATVMIETITPNEPAKVARRERVKKVQIIPRVAETPAESDEINEGGVEEITDVPIDQPLPSPLSVETSVANTGAFAPVIPGWLLYDNSEFGFQIQHPADWNVFSLVVSEAKNPGKSFILETTDRSKIMEISFTDLQARVPSFEGQGNPSTTTIDGKKLLDHAFPNGYCDQNGCGSPFVILWTTSPVHGGTYVSFVLVHDTTIQGEYQQMLESFRFLQ